MIEIAGLVAAALAIVFGGFLKGAVGMGAPLVAVPALAGIYGVRTAIAVMTVPADRQQSMATVDLPERH